MDAIAVATAPRTGGVKKKFAINTNIAPLLATVAVAALLFGFGAMRYNGFSSSGNLVALFNDNAFIAIAAVGASFVILSGGIDLSTGAMIAFTSILSASLIERHNLHPAVAFALVLLIGCIAGSIMGCLIAFFELPPFMVTLAGMFFLRAMGFVIEPQAMGIKNDLIIDWSAMSATIGSVRIPVLTFVMIAVYLVAILIAHLTGFGRNIYAIGGSENSARLMGVPVMRTKILLYTMAGFCSALAGIVATVYKSSGDPAGFVGTELDAIAAVVIGGTLLTGGTGYLIGTLLGVLILGLIQAIINFEGTLNAAWTRITVGLLVLGFVLFQRLLQRLAR